MKFDKKATSNMQNSMVTSILSVLDWKYLPFLANMAQKIAIISITLIWVGGGGGGKHPLPCLKLIRIMLETSNLVGEYTHIRSFRKCIF